MRRVALGGIDLQRDGAILRSVFLDVERVAEMAEQRIEEFLRGRVHVLSRFGVVPAAVARGCKPRALWLAFQHRGGLITGKVELQDGQQTLHRIVEGQRGSEVVTEKPEYSAA